MIKHIAKHTKVVFSEIPDEITLALNITNCLNNCIGCHSSFLKQDIGEEVTESILDKYIKDNVGITCICFMGEGNDRNSLISMIKWIKKHHSNLKIALYSGRMDVEGDLWELLDYVKLGPYIPEYGPLNKETTNQTMWKIENGVRKDITSKFWKKID